MCFFFVKQKTAYEMRISDWSSDVCSSDLAPDKAAVVAKFHPLLAHKGPCEADRLYVVPAVQLCNAIEMPGDQITTVKLVRSHCGLLGCLRQHLVTHTSQNGPKRGKEREGREKKSR